MISRLLIDKGIAEYCDAARTLKAVKAIASRYEMSEVFELATEAEKVTEKHIMPEAELLQQLINRLMVNSHQATRLIHKLHQQRKTG